MKLAYLARESRWLCLTLLAWALLLLAPGGVVVADEAGQPFLAADASAPLFGGFLQDVVGNRTRLIQASIVFVLFGIALLWKK